MLSSQRPLHHFDVLGLHPHLYLILVTFNPATGNAHTPNFLILIFASFSRDFSSSCCCTYTERQAWLLNLR